MARRVARHGAQDDVLCMLVCLCRFIYVGLIEELEKRYYE